MGQKTVRFSDLSGELITRDDALARIVIHEHPELGDSPVEIEALADEAAAIEKAALRVAVVELYLPGEAEPRRVAMEAAAFDEMAADKPMSELLLTARPARAARRAKAAAPRGISYDTLEHAGEPHKGRITEAERELVRDHLDAINDRLAAQGMRTIDPGDPEHAARYGLTGWRWRRPPRGTSAQARQRARHRPGGPAAEPGRPADLVSYAGHHMIAI